MFDNRDDLLNKRIMRIQQDKEEIAIFDDMHSFTPVRVTALAQAIRSTKTLKVLNLAMVYLELEQLKQLGSAILANSSIETLILPICETDSFDIKEFLSKIHEHVSSHSSKNVENEFRLS